MIDWAQKKTRLGEAIKVAKGEINIACEAAILVGFVSAALGADHTYDSSERDQLNLVGAGNAGVDLPYTCTDANSVKAEVLHTALQIRQVYLDGLAFKSMQLSKARALKMLIDKATTVAKVKKVVW